MMAGLRALPAVTLFIGAFGLSSITNGGERLLSEAEIKSLLAGNTVIGEDKSGPWRQYFDASGATTYVQGAEPPSHGRWTTRDGKYCSQWPPAEGWACYGLTGDPDADPPPITWIGDSGSRYPGIVLKGNRL